MSVQAFSHVINHSTHKGGELLCLMMIANHAHADGTNAFPSLRTLAGECRMSERQIRRIIDKLETSGELLVDRGIGRGNVHNFSVVMGQPVPISAPKEKRTLCQKPASQKADIMSDKSGHFDTVKVDIFDNSLSYIEPSFEPSLKREEQCSNSPLFKPSLALDFAPDIEPLPGNSPAENPSLPGSPNPANVKKSRPPRAAFAPPTLEEAEAYFMSLGRADLAPAFMNHFLANGWVVGHAKAAMKDWQAAARAWKDRDEKWSQPQAGSSAPANFASNYATPKGLTHVPSAHSVTAGTKQLSIAEYRKQQLEQQQQLEQPAA